MASPARYDVQLAPGGLALVHGLLNTVSARGAGDQLETLETAREWVGDRPAPALVAADLRRLRALRDAVRAAVAGDGPDLRATVDVSFAGAAPRGRAAAEWLRSAVLLECFVAQLDGTWPRLKLCANPACPIAFYDRSRNRSGVWHDVRTCGNVINLRASRARRRA
jgi:predicted RNA-binding Zn ribbon-like protein